MQTKKTKSPSKIKNARLICSQVIVNLDHSRVFPAACLTDGLFRPLRKGDRKKGKLDLQYTLKGYTLWWRNYEPLGIQEQSVFLALHRIAAEQSRRDVLELAPDAKDLLELRDLLKLELKAKEETCGYTKTSLYEIAKLIGLSDSGQNLNNIALSLVRLSSVVCAIYKTGDLMNKYWQANLISHLQIDNGQVLIAVNSMLASALVKVPASFISMADQRKLKSDASKRLHMWLSSWAGEGENKIGLDTLIPHVWGAGKMIKADLWNRRRYLRAAISEIDSLSGWVCAENEPGMITVIKPQLALKP
jgi:hypothetical protein